MSQTFTIPRSKLDTILARLRRSQKRNARNGLPSPSVKVVSEGFHEVEVRDALSRMRGGDRDYRTLRVATVSVELDGFTARAGEWEVIGYRWGHVVTQPDRTRVTRIGCSEGVPDDIARRPELCCEHCNAARERLSSCIVRKVDGTAGPLEVGSTCMSAFLADGGSPAVLAGISDNAMLLQEISEMAAANFLLSEDDIADEVETVLAVALSIIDREGFVPSREALPGCPPTWVSVYDDVRRYRVPAEDDDSLSVNFSDFMEAGNLIAWLDGQSSSADASPFMSHAASVVRKGVTSKQDVAVLTALAGSYRRHLEEKARRDLLAEVTRESVHVGIKGERTNLVCAIRSVRPYAGRFGEGDVVTMTDGGGNLLLWFSSGRKHGMRAGRTYEIAATVKGHDIAERGPHAGAAQTVLTRVQPISDLGQTVDPEAIDPVAAEEKREFDELIGYLAPAAGR